MCDNINQHSEIVLPDGERFCADCCSVKATCSRCENHTLYVFLDDSEVIIWCTECEHYTPEIEQVEGLREQIHTAYPQIDSF